MQGMLSASRVVAVARLSAGFATRTSDISLQTVRHPAENVIV